MSSKSNHPRLPRSKDIQPEQLALINKLVVSDKDKHRPNSQGDYLREAAPAEDTLKRVVDSTAMSNRDADNLFQVLPEMELVAEIFVSAVMAPGDLIQTDLHYDIDVNPEIPADITGSTLRLIKDEFEKVYKIKDMLYDILMDVLFKRGSYSLLVLPETSIDNLINSDMAVSKESLSTIGYKEGKLDSYGLLGSTAPVTASTGISLESVLSPRGAAGGGQVMHNDQPLDIELVDNPDILKMPTLIERVRSEQVLAIYKSKSIALESKDRRRINKQVMSNSEVVRTYYKPRKYVNTPVSTVITRTQASRDPIGAPVVLNPSNESLIPVTVPGNRRKHIGYLALLDVDGNFISMDHSENYWDDSRMYAELTSTNRKGSMSSVLLEEVRQAAAGRKCSNTQLIRDTQRFMGAIVEDNVKNALKSGALTGDYDIQIPEEVMRLMLQRSLQQKKTKLLYIPSELLIYFAVDYNNLGIGKSMIENGKTLGVLRALLLFAGTHSAIKGATDSKMLNIEVEEHDEEPFETVSYLLHEFERMQPHSLPIHTVNPLQLTDFVAKAGRTVNITGNSRIPSTSFSVEERASVSRDIDNEFSEDLRKRHIETFGMNEAIIDAASGADFATQITTQNMFFLKRIIRVSDKISPHLSRFGRTYTHNHGGLIEGILEIISGNKDQLPKEWRQDHEGLARYLIDNLTIALPKPETDTIEQRMEAFDQFAESIDKVLDSYFYEDVMGLINDDEAQTNLERVKASIRNKELRDFIKRRSIIPELDYLDTWGESDGPLNQATKDGVKYAKQLRAMLKRNVDKLFAEEDDTDDGYSSGSGDVPGDSGADDDVDLYGEGVDTDAGMVDDAGFDDGSDGESGDLDTEEVPADDDLDAESAQDDLDLEDEL